MDIFRDLWQSAAKFVAASAVVIGVLVTSAMTILFILAAVPNYWMLAPVLIVFLDLGTPFWVFQFVKGAHSIAQRIIARLNDNYGAIGLKYAQYLGANFDAIDKEVGQFLSDLGKEVNTKTDERFWLALIACLCMGARYAAKLGFANIDEKNLKAFLIKTLNQMRIERAQSSVDMKDVMNVSNVLAQFLNWARARHTLYTNKIHSSRGKPSPGTIQIMRDASRLDAIYVHIGMDDKKMRISSSALDDWLAEKGFSRQLFSKALTSQFGMRSVRGRIGSGTGYAVATEYLLEIDLAGSQHANFIDEL